VLYSFCGQKPEIDPSSYVSPEAVIIGGVEIGPRCYVGPYAVIRGDAARIVIGPECAVEDGVVIHAGGSGCSESVIGPRVTIGHGAIVHSRRIGPSACIGMGAVVSVNSEIGEYAVIAEGAVVRRGQTIPDRVVAGGTPASVLRPLEDRDIKAWDATKDWYVGLTGKYLLDGTAVRTE
jgi:carbonic anhydrase/acetyltransferase-like protein (isoleucine patch superfamily)